LSVTPGTFAYQATKAKFKMASHLAVLDSALMDIATERIDRLIVEMPPRHGKSFLCSTFFPAYYLGTFPERNFILTSATDQLAMNFSFQVRDIMREHGPEFFGTSLREDSRARALWHLKEGGSLRAAGVGTGIVGTGADLLLIDDYFRNVESAMSIDQRDKLYEWYLSTSTTRLTPNGAIVVIATRWGPDDLIGRLLRDQEAGGDKWHRISLKAIAGADDPMGRKPGEALWPARYDLSKLLRRKAMYHAAGYPWMWEALYQQEPPATLDSEFDPDYFKESEIMFDADAGEGPDAVVLKIMALDPSLGRTDRSDYSAIIYLTLDARGIMWIDADVRRRDAAKIAAHVVEGAQWFQPNSFAVEANAFQSLLASNIANNEMGVPLPVVAVDSRAPKETRIRALAPYLKRYEFRFRKRSPGVALLLEQLKGFPGHKYKDAPDALSMAVAEARRMLFGGNAVNNGEEQATQVTA